MPTATPGSSRIASLPMYDLPEVREATDSLWRSVGEHLQRRGIDAPFVLDRSAEYQDAWTAERTIASQSCGYPLVVALRGAVRVVGGFVYDVDSADSATTRSVLIVGVDQPDEALQSARTAAVNAFDSLSGWVSLCAAFGGVPWSGPTVKTGAHVDSIAAVESGAADVAAVDAVTFALLSRHRPAAVRGVRVAGHGPRIPSLPLITLATTTDSDLAELRDAFAWAASAPETAAARAELLITGFRPLDFADYDYVADLVPGLAEWRSAEGGEELAAR